jgi:hypothetical protein
MEFSAFLEHRGMRLAGDRGDGPIVVVESPHRFPEDRCHPSQRFRCVQAPSAKAGELIVFLPGRTVSPRELDTLEARTETIFAPRPSESAVEGILRTLARGEPGDDQTMRGYAFRR